MDKKGYREMVRDIESACICKIVDEYVKDDTAKEIIKLKLLHGMNEWMPLVLEKLKR